jgi:hypothetical protein
MDVFWNHLAILPGAAGSAADGVEFGDRLRRQDQVGRCDVLAKVRHRRGASVVTAAERLARPRR